MEVIIPAAGGCRRYREAGITIPKGLIEFSRKGCISMTMIEHIYKPHFPRLEPIVVLLKNTVSPFSRTGYIEDSRGQAETVLKILPSIDLNQSILVLNSDVGYEYPLSVFVQQASKFESAILVFPAQDTSFSYVNNFPIFDVVSEKEVISDWAVAGAYYFRSARRLYQAISNQLESKDTHAGEYYLSGSFAHLSGKKLAVAMERKQLLQWGTPEDLARDPYITITNPNIKEILSKLC
jgi:hypothetical protein